MLEKIRPSLSKNQLALTQISVLEGLKTVLVDTETGESIGSIVPYIGTTDMQKLGGAISYARRYSLIAMFNLESEDDDGNVAQTTRQETKEYIKSHNIDALLKNIKEWAIVCSDADEAIKLASEKYIVADWAKKEIKEKWKTIFI